MFNTKRPNTVKLNSNLLGSLAPNLFDLPTIFISVPNMSVENLVVPSQSLVNLTLPNRSTINI